MEIQQLQPIPMARMKEIEDFFYMDGVLQAHHTSTIRDHFTDNELRLFMGKHGIYVLPTIELIQFISGTIAKSGAVNPIEIGSGNGTIARESGIPATDSYMQDPLEFRHTVRTDDLPLYDLFISGLHNMPYNGPVKYGKNVKKFEGFHAVKHYKADFVLCNYVTQRYNEKFHNLGGNHFGVDFLKVMNFPTIRS